jgi:hypothetical protein
MVSSFFHMLMYVDIGVVPHFRLKSTYIRVEVNSCSMANTAGRWCRGPYGRLGLLKPLDVCIRPQHL